MAVTIHTSPQLYTPSDNPVTWVFSSDQTAQANFSYLVELYINSVLDSRHLVFPERGARAHFDASERMKAFTPVAQLTNAIVSNAGNVATVYIKVIERYGTPPSNQANATSSTVNSFKACLSEQDFTTWDYTDHLSGLTGSTFMNEFVRTGLTLLPTQDFYLSCITNEVATNFVINYLDSDGVFISSQVTAIATSVKIAQMNIKRELLTIPVNAVSFDFFFISGGNFSEIVNIQLVELDVCDTNTHLIWLNKFGSFDVFTFNHNFITRTEIQELQYQSQFGQWVGTNFVYSTATSGNKSYVKTIQDSGSIVSGWISQSVQEFIVKLYESPYVLIQIGLTTYYQIVVNNSSYEIKQEKYEELFNEIVEFSKSNTRKSINL
jgi:hypothetical protein